MRIVVVGIGAVGGYFGGRMAQAGIDVVFVARGSAYEALRRDGLRVESVAGDFTIAPLQVVRTAAEAERADAVVLGIKAWQVGEVVDGLRGLVERGAFVVPLQNGVEVPAQLAGLVGARSVVGAYCRIGSVAIGPGRIRHGWHGYSAPLLAIGELDRRTSPRLERLVGELARCIGFDARCVPDVEAAMWGKFVFLAPFSALGATEGAPLGELRSTPRTRELLIAAIEEVVRVGRARRVALGPDVVESAIANGDALPPEAMASMARDVLAGRPSEVDALVDAVPRLGRQSGVATPVFDRFSRTLAPIERAARARGAEGQR
jgi:2-dehydropantoate 2-reductase